MNIAQALALRGEAESYERQENAWLLEHITKIDSFDLVMKKDQVLTDEQEQAYLLLWHESKQVNLWPM